MIFRKASANGKSRDFGTLPFDGEKNGSGAEDIEVVRVVRVLPNVFAAQDEMFPKGLLQPGVKLISKSRSQRGSRTGEALGNGHDRVDYGVGAPGAREDQVLIERAFHGAGVRNSQHRIRLLDVI